MSHPEGQLLKVCGCEVRPVSGRVEYGGSDDEGSAEGDAPGCQVVWDTRDSGGPPPSPVCVGGC